MMLCITHNTLSDSVASCSKEFQHPVLTVLGEMYDRFVAGDITQEIIESSEAFATIKNLIDANISQERERTSQLWLMYRKMISII